MISLVPKLNLKPVKHLDDHRDFQAYSFKLEEAVKFQREKVLKLEAENQQLQIKFKKEKKAVKEALHLNSRLQNQLSVKKNKIKILRQQLGLSE